MNNPKVSIIILNYNGWKDTIECLESVLRNDYPNYQDKVKQSFTLLASISDAYQDK